MPAKACLMGGAAAGRASLAKSRRWATKLRRAIPRALGTFSVVFACIAGGATGQAQTRDLWQTYMEAALGSNRTGDLTVEAITLNAAFAFARRHDPDGQHPVLTRLPLMIAYSELGREDLFKPLFALGLDIDVSNLDARYDSYIATIDSYVSSYFDDFRAHDDDQAREVTRQEMRFYGTKNSYLIEIALLTKLRPEDRIGLANAMAMAGRAYTKRDDFDCAEYHFARAFQIFQDFEQLRDATSAAGANFTVGVSTAAGDRQGATGQLVADAEVALMQALVVNMKALASRTLHPQSGEPPAAKVDVSACDSFGPPARTTPAVGFDAQVARASEYVDTNFKLASQLHQYWADNPLFGRLNYGLATIYDLEFRMAKAHPNKYPDALAKARKAYEASLPIMTHAYGMNSQYVRLVATKYVDLLVEAQLNDEAKKIEIQYAVTRSAPRASNEKQ